MAKTKRIERDRYLTPRWMTESLLHHVPEIHGRLVEPCVGDGAISRVLVGADRAEYVVTNDIDPAMPADSHHDAAAPVFWSQFGARFGRPDWVISNPPWSMPADGPALPVEILKHALATSRVGVALLLRITFLEPCRNRGAWLDAHPPSRQIVLPRYSFRGNGATDSATACWFIWSHESLSGPPIVVDHAAMTRGEQVRA